MMAKQVIAIDGPSGVGKGTVARAVAEILNTTYVDTGAMYRTLAWKAISEGLSIDNESQMEQLATRSRFVFDEKNVLIDGQDVTEKIRTPEMDNAAAKIAQLSRVRAVLVDRQRAFADEGSVVMEGRDIGTVVLPDAVVKIFLDATPQERALRRLRDTERGFSEATLRDVARALEERDHADRTRSVSPLTKAEDAILIDTTNVSIAGVVETVISIIKEKCS